MLLGLLLPDPADPHCPEDFKKKAREILAPVPVALEPDDDGLRRAFLKFIGDFSNWDLSNNNLYMETARSLIKAARGDDVPLVVDPFAGGGSIPLEALRLGCDAFASDLNPVACLILKVMLEDVSRHGPGLAEELRRVGGKIKQKAEKELAEFYPKDPDGATPTAYLWSRTVKCESPNCGAEIPLARSFWLCRKPSRKLALRYRVVQHKGEPPCVEFEIFEPKADKEVPGGTVTRARATCPCCNIVLPPERIRVQLSEQNAGADVILDEQGNRIGGARLLAVVIMQDGLKGKNYRLPSVRDYKSVFLSSNALEKMAGKKLPHGLYPIPNEERPESAADRVRPYGVINFRDLTSCRQRFALSWLVNSSWEIKDPAVRRAFTLVIGRCIDYWSSGAVWAAGGEFVAHTFGLQVIPIGWDFPEAAPWADSSGNFEGAIDWVSRVIENLPLKGSYGQVQLADACKSPLPDLAANVWFTDPPYYDAIRYADLSDSFFVWFKRALPPEDYLCDPFDRMNPLTPKNCEAVEDKRKYVNNRPKDRAFFEELMANAFTEGRRVLNDDGVACVVFAHKTTEGWEALLSGMIQGGWTITGSWPIATERPGRLRSQESAALATSVHLVCRPRPEDVPVGDWTDVLRELPKRVGDWMERLQGEGIRGADLVFACIGPALEIYSRYAKVVDAQDREIPLGGDPLAAEPHKRGYLAYVWEAVGRSALEQVLGTAESKTQESTAEALEEDSRLTALFLWTLQSTNGNGDKNAKKKEEAAPREKKGGFNLIFDVVRRFAQPLGIILPDWEGRIIETKKGVVKLLMVKERAKQLFGDQGARVVADQLETRSTKDLQLNLFSEGLEDAAPQIRGGGRKRTRRGSVEISDDALKARREATTLDRVHAAMLLQASGRANALRALLKGEMDRGPDFLRLANALSALYPRWSEEKRLVDAMLLAVPR